jgi:DNA-directed RNA polymerase specialized sigma24 family protein
MVDDLTTEVFLAAIDAAGTYRQDRGSEEAWLFGIARNVMASEQRRAARELHKSGRAAGRRTLDADDIARLEERIDAERAARHARDGHSPGTQQAAHPGRRGLARLAGRRAGAGSDPPDGHPEAQRQALTGT